MKRFFDRQWQKIKNFFGWNKRKRKNVAADNSFDVAVDPELAGDLVEAGLDIALRRRAAACGASFAGAGGSFGGGGASGDFSDVATPDATDAANGLDGVGEALAGFTAAAGEVLGKTAEGAGELANGVGAAAGAVLEGLGNG